VLLADGQRVVREGLVSLIQSRPDIAAIFAAVRQRAAT
jgi:hypothetical protein